MKDSFSYTLDGSAARSKPRKRAVSFQYYIILSTIFKENFVISPPPLFGRLNRVISLYIPNALRSHNYAFPPRKAHKVVAKIAADESVHAHKLLLYLFFFITFYIQTD